MVTCHMPIIYGKHLAAQARGGKSPYFCNYILRAIPLLPNG